MIEALLPLLIIFGSFFAVLFLPQGTKKPQGPPNIDRGKNWPVSPPPPRVKR